MYITLILACDCPVFLIHQIFYGLSLVHPDIFYYLDSSSFFYQSNLLALLLRSEKQLFSILNFKFAYLPVIYANLNELASYITKTHRVLCTSKCLALNFVKNVHPCFLIECHNTYKVLDSPTKQCGITAEQYGSY